MEHIILNQPFTNSYYNNLDLETEMQNALEPIQRSEIEFSAKTYEKNKNSKLKRSRTAFTSLQLMKLESEFKSNQFLSRNRRIVISQDLCLSEKQVKVWFQNRRMKSKKGNQKSMTSSYAISSPSTTNSYSSLEDHSKIVANLLSHAPRAQPITNWGSERTTEGFWKNMEHSFANFESFPNANYDLESNVKISPNNSNGLHAYVSCGNRNEFQFTHSTQQEINSYNTNYNRNQGSNSYSHQEFQTPGYNTQWHEQYNMNKPEYPLVTSAEHTIPTAIPKEVSYLQKFYDCKV